MNAMNDFLDHLETVAAAAAASSSTSGPVSRPAPLDQADGLRRMFAGTRVRFVPVVSNPHLNVGGVLLERLCSAFGEHGAHTLVLDAAERAQPAGEMALIELAECLEPLSEHVTYLTARGLPLKFADAQGFTSSLLDAVVDAAGAVDVVLVHAPASDLCRLFNRRDPRHAAREGMRPLYLSDDRPTSVTHAYAAMKLLTQRAGLMVHDLLLAAAPRSTRVQRIAVQLATCADTFLGAAVRESMQIDPSAQAADPVSPGLRRWAFEWLSDGAGAARAADAPQPWGPAGAMPATY
jgi:flagellar biosynthesis protein FlhG